MFGVTFSLCGANVSCVVLQNTLSGTPPTTDRDVAVQKVMVDYTPPSYITLLFTDLGILTPSAVSDELIKLYL